MYKSNIFSIMLLLSTYVLFANIVEVENEKQLLEKITPNGNPVPAVIKFSTTWCGACKIVKKPFEKITAQPELSEITFIHIDGDKGKQLMRKFNVSSFPTFLLMHGTDEKHRSHFFDSQDEDDFQENITEKINEFLLNKTGPAKKVINGKVKKTISPLEWLKHAFVTIFKSIQNFFTWIVDSISNLFAR